MIWIHPTVAHLSHSFGINQPARAVLLQRNCLEQQWVCLCSTAGKTRNELCDFSDGILDKLDNYRKSLIL